MSWDLFVSIWGVQFVWRLQRVESAHLWLVRYILVPHNPTPCSLGHP